MSTLKTMSKFVLQIIFVAWFVYHTHAIFFDAEAGRWKINEIFEASKLLIIVMIIFFSGVQVLEVTHQQHLDGKPLQQQHARIIIACWIIASMTLIFGLITEGVTGNVFSIVGGGAVLILWLHAKLTKVKS